ncbi:MAG TPA: ornithine cyclodeaminase family protein [Chloroflexota bacterium]|nr:ornithine cyclodeaminase family protein [Chloroflexota bacterium]
MLYLSNADVESLLDMPSCLDALRAGYADLARGDAAYIPRIDIYAPTGRPEDYYRWGSMSGVCRTTGVVAVRIKSDVVYWTEQQTEEKYCIEPGTYSGIILCYSIRNGEPLALMNDGYLQHMRVGACAGLGADELARKDASVLGLLGSGGMARTYLEAIAQVRGLKQVKVYSPTAGHRLAFAETMTERLGIEIVPVDSPEKAVRGSHVVATATDSIAATFDAAWLDAGAHVTCVTRRELSTAMTQRADVAVQLGIQSLPPGNPLPGLEWPASSMAAYITGQPEERARIPRSEAGQGTQWTNLVDIQAGRATGRTSPEQVSLFVNTGTQGLQFAAVAGRVYQLARERGLGEDMPAKWFLQDIRD